MAIHQAGIKGQEEVEIGLTAHQGKFKLFASCAGIELGAACCHSHQALHGLGVGIAIHAEAQAIAHGVFLAIDAGADAGDQGAHGDAVEG